MKCNSVAKATFTLNEGEEYWRKKKREENACQFTGMRPSNLVDWTIFPRRSVSLAMGLLHVLHDDLPDFAYSAFHGFWSWGLDILSHFHSLARCSHSSLLLLSHLYISLIIYFNYITFPYLIYCCYFLFWIRIWSILNSVLDKPEQKKCTRHVVLGHPNNNFSTKLKVKCIVILIKEYK